MGQKRSTFLLTVLVFGMAFLYIPIFLLIVYVLPHGIVGRLEQLYAHIRARGG